MIEISRVQRVIPRGEPRHRYGEDGRAIGRYVQAQAKREILIYSNFNVRMADIREWIIFFEIEQERGGVGGRSGVGWGYVAESKRDGTPRH